MLHNFAKDIHEKLEEKVFYLKIFIIIFKIADYI